MTPRSTYIEELAEAIAEGAGAGSGSGTNLDAILACEGLTLSSNDYGPGFDGMLEYTGGRFHIYCNLHKANRADSGRVRFTTAHELGHFFIDEHRRGLLKGTFPTHGSRSDYQSKNPLEAEADLFAAALLMPRARFKEQARRGPIGAQAIVRLATHFQTSLAATAIRYVQTHDSACAIVRWPALGDPWMAVSPPLAAVGARFLVADQASLPPDSATGMALRSAPGYRVTKGTTAPAWFRRSAPFVWRETIMLEEAMSLGSAGALTFLRPLDYER